MLRLIAACLAAVLLGASPVRADVMDYVGHPIGTVTIERDGRPTTEIRLLALVQVADGARLSIAAVREAITHLYGLGTFEDIRVHASLRGEVVDLRYELRSLRPIEDIEFSGVVSGIDDDRLRRLVTERFGASPRANRVDDMARLVEEDLKVVGFLNARVEPHILAIPTSNRSTLRFTLTPGARARVGTIELTGDAGMPVATVLERLSLTSGRVYDRDGLTRRIGEHLDDQRARGFLAARMTVSALPVDDGQTVNLTVTAVQGPHVRIAFQGDPIPAGRQADLAPIAREGSADEDLLEDSTVRIREFLTAQGYRDARVTFERQDRDGEMLITFTVARGPQYRVDRVEVSGVSALPLATLQDRMRVRSGQPFSVAALDADRAAVEGLYRRDGYASVAVEIEVGTEQAIGDGSQVPVNLQVRVVEGARTLVNAVTFEGNHGVAEAALRETLSLQPGRPYFVTQLALDRDTVQLYYANRGYQSATVTTDAVIAPDGSSVDIAFTVSEGTRVFVDHVLISGNERTRTATIERELQFKAGDPLGLESISESQRRLSALGLFRRVRITELGHGDARRDILVAVEEAPATTVGYGGGLQALQLLRNVNDTGASADLQFGPRVFFETGRRNLFGKNRSVNVFTRVSVRPQNGAATRDFVQYRVIGTFREPRALGTGADAYLTGTLEQERRSSFNFSRRALNAQLGQKLTRYVSLTGSYQIQRTELFDSEQVDPLQKLLIDRAFPQLRLSSFSLAGVRDTRDDIADPFTGLFLSASGQLAGRRIGSEVGFAKTFMSAQRFTPIPHTPRIVLATSVRLGMASGFPRQVAVLDASGGATFNADGTPSLVTVRDLPASERFFAGGDTTMRGFALDQVGAPNTIDKDGFPIGGGGLVILNAEFRVPVKGGLGVVGFVDAGNVFARTSEIDFGGMRSAVGFGVRYKSPIGPIRFDVGFKTRRNEITPGNRESASALHISLGQAF